MSRAISVASAATDAQAYTGAATLMGFVATGSTTSVVRLRDGTTATDPVKAVIGIPADGTAAAELPAAEFATGIFVDRDGTNASELVLYIQ
ncbi:hypothetical protein [Streptomyces sp. UG1]|uniref:hypothetical protein n=1 Tax=Streptomyces sp. UG1 TaxID=3417652 RepID=UPI003CE8B05A